MMDSRRGFFAKLGAAIVASRLPATARTPKLSDFAPPRITTPALVCRTQALAVWEVGLDGHAKKITIKSLES